MPEPLTIPGAPAELMAKINARRARIPAGMVMIDSDSEGAKPDDADAEAQKEGFKSDHSKQSVLADLASERAARQDLEKRVNDLQGSAEILENLRKALTPEGEKPDPTKDLAQTVAELQQWKAQREQDDARDVLARRIAEAAGVTDLADLALIKAQADEVAMKALADRLKSGAKPGTPKPDRSVGQGGDSQGGGSVSAGRDLYRDRHKKN